MADEMEVDDKKVFEEGLEREIDRGKHHTAARVGEENTTRAEGVVKEVKGAGVMEVKGAGVMVEDPASEETQTTESIQSLKGPRPEEEPPSILFALQKRKENYEGVERSRAIKMTKFVDNPSITIQIQVKCFQNIQDRMVSS